MKGLGECNHKKRSFFFTESLSERRYASSSRKERMLKIPMKYISSRLPLMPLTKAKMCVTKDNFRNKMEKVEIISLGGISSARILHVMHISIRQLHSNYKYREVNVTDVSTPAQAT